MTAMMRAKTSVPMYAGLTWSTLAAGIVSALLVGVIVGTFRRSGHRGCRPWMRFSANDATLGVAVLSF
jgi:hypothetical protein